MQTGLTSLLIHTAVIVALISFQLHIQLQIYQYSVQKKLLWVFYFFLISFRNVTYGGLITKMFSILIGYLLFVKCVIDAHVDVSVTQLPNNGTITKRSANFKKIPNFHSYFSIWVDRVESVLACAAKCMTLGRCRSFSAKKTGNVNCALLDGTLATNHYYIHKNYFYDHYEMQVSEKQL